MKQWGFVFGVMILTLFIFPLAGLLAEENDDEQKIETTEEIQVTATRVPEAVEPEPASITVVTGEELRNTGANDLSSALALTTGVSIARGGDGGPASYVPELWGLREFDAFLLVVDNVPWGGAFVPDLSTLDLNDIERIEILRGPAPVMYGATSFVGVIHVIHRSASAPGTNANAYFGNFSTGGGAARIALPSSESWKHAVSVNFDSKGYRDDRTDYNKGHVLYRGQTGGGNGKFHLDADLTFLTQDPASPHPRAGAVLDPSVPLDANHNPADSQQDENRYHFVGGYDRQVWGTDWTILAAFTQSNRDVIKGFLSSVDETVDPNTAGFRQDVNQTDLYLDTHFAWKASPQVQAVFGSDYLFGKGDAKSENFDYFSHLDGSNPPDSFDQVVQERPQLEDERNFFGLYGQIDWNPAARWLVQGGLRFNSTHEKQEGEVLPGDAGGEGEEEEGGEDSRSFNRLSGTIGVSFLAWTNTENNVWVFGDYRNAFKPAAVDFGPEAEGEILDPETANTYEGGVKGRTLRGRLNWEVALFRMDFENLVTSTLVDGRPVLINSGTQRFTGVELETEVMLTHDALLQLTYAHHSAKFRDFIQLFDDVPTQLAGKKLEMSPDDLAAIGVVYAPPGGINGSFIVNYIGDRFLNKRNTAPADSFATLAFGIGYRFGHNNLRFDIDNATDERDPISESELGDAQYYRQPARNFRFGWQYGF